jgi:hypothetical protein
MSAGKKTSGVNNNIRHILLPYYNRKQLKKMKTHQNRENGKKSQADGSSHTPLAAAAVGYR